MRYMSIKDTCRETGLSQYYLRTGCKNNSIRHIRSGIKIYIDVDALMNVVKDYEKTIEKEDSQ